MKKIAFWGAALIAAGAAFADGGNLRYSIMVNKFENKANWTGRWDLGDAWGTIFTDQLVQSGKFIVLGEADMRGAALAEQDLAASGRVAGGKKAPKTGRMTGAQLLVKGVNGVCLINANGTPTLLATVNRYISAEQLEALDKSLKDRLMSLNLRGQIGKVAYISDPLMKGDEFKLNRKRLREDYLSGALSRVDSQTQAAAGQEDELTLHLRQMVAAALDKELDAVSPDADFFADLGGTSLDYFALIAKLQEDFSLPFPQNADGSLNTVKELHDYIRDHVD